MIAETAVDIAQNTLANLDDDIEDKSYYSGRKEMAEDLLVKLLADKDNIKSK